MERLAVIPAGTSRSAARLTWSFDGAEVASMKSVDKPSLIEMMRFLVGFELKTESERVVVGRVGRMKGRRVECVEGRLAGKKTLLPGATVTGFPALAA
jgi:hypothetical protein